MQLKDEQKYKILFFSEQGLKGREIARKMGLNPTTVNKLLKKHKETGSIVHKAGNGRRLSITPEVSAFIDGEIDKNPKCSLRKMASMIKERCDSDISHVTIKRYLNHNKLYAKTPIKKPFLREANIEKRKIASKKFLFMSENDVKRIIFSDESKFNLFYSDGRQMVWRNSNSGLKNKNLAKTIKHGGGSIMVWACFSYYGIGKIVIIDGPLTGLRYVDLLSRNLFESANMMGLESFIFQQDNDPKHTSNIANEYFKQKGIEVLEWPPQSPDLNPIEHLWAHIKVKVGQKLPKNKKELIEIIKQEWNSIPVEVCQKYALSFKNRALSVYEASGNHTFY